MVGWKIPFSDAAAADAARGERDPRRGGRTRSPRRCGSRRRRSTKGCAGSPTLQPEQLPSDGIGTLKRKRFWADIVGCAHSPETLFALFRTHFDEVTPVFVDAKAEPRTTDVIEEGETLTLALPMRGHVQVRVASSSEPRRVTLLTLEGHPLAGAVRFLCEPRGDGGAVPGRGLRPAGERDRLHRDARASATGCRTTRGRTWWRTMVQVSGGRRPRACRARAARWTSEEAAAIERWVEELAGASDEASRRAEERRERGSATLDYAQRHDHARLLRFLPDHVEGPRLAVRAAAELVAVAREPPVEAVGERAHEGNLEQPRDESALRQLVEQLLDRGGALPRRAVGGDELERLGVGARRESTGSAPCTPGCCDGTTSSR